MSAPLSEEEALNECINNFYTIATLQGRIAYLLMSVHAVNPAILTNLFHRDPHGFLLANMLYGTAVHIFSRANMTPLNFSYRTTFSVLGSLMFNYSVMSVYGWLAERLQDRPISLGMTAFTAGRLMMLCLLAFLYHVDTRRPGQIRRSSLFDSMYDQL